MIVISLLYFHHIQIVINDPTEIVEVESAPPMEDFPEMTMDDSEPSSKLDIADDFTDSILKSLDFTGTSSLTSMSPFSTGKMSIKLNSVATTKKYKGEERGEFSFIDTFHPTRAQTFIKNFPEIILFQFVMSQKCY